MTSYINSRNRHESAFYRFLASVSLPRLPAKLTPMPARGEGGGSLSALMHFAKSVPERRTAGPDN